MSRIKRIKSEKFGTLTVEEYNSQMYLDDLGVLYKEPAISFIKDGEVSRIGTISYRETMDKRVIGFFCIVGNKKYWLPDDFILTRDYIKGKVCLIDCRDLDAPIEDNHGTFSHVEASTTDGVNNENKSIEEVKKVETKPLIGLRSYGVIVQTQKGVYVDLANVEESTLLSFPYPVLTGMHNSFFHNGDFVDKETNQPYMEEPFGALFGFRFKSKVASIYFNEETKDVCGQFRVKPLAEKNTELKVKQIEKVNGKYTFYIYSFDVEDYTEFKFTEAIKGIMQLVDVIDSFDNACG